MQVKERSPRQRVRLIILMAVGCAVAVAAMNALMSVGLGSGAVRPRILRGAGIGLVCGLLIGLVNFELLYQVNRRAKGRPLARGIGVGVPIVIMGVYMPLMMSAGTGRSGLGLLGWAWTLPVGIGAGLITAGWATRTGDSRHCPKCDYEFAFADGDEDAPVRCPECGTGWLGRLVTGRRVQSRPLIGAGVGVLAATLLLAVTLFASGGFIARAMPTPALIAWLGTSPLIGGDEAWAELATRTLTPEQRADLATRLLDLRLAERFRLTVEGKEWLDAETAAGTLPAGVQERFFAEMFRGELDVPRRVRVGEPFEVGFKHTDANDGFNYKCFLYVGGFAVGDAPLVGQRNEGYYPNLIDRARGTPYTPVSESLVANKPGPATVRADVWLMVQTGFPATITWNDDGTPVVPPTAAWVKRVEMVREIEVTGP